MRATHRGTRKNISFNGVTNGIASFSVQSYTGAEQYQTTIDVNSKEATCNCGRFKSRVEKAAHLMQLKPTVGTVLVCKHIEDCGLEAERKNLFAKDKKTVATGINLSPLTSALGKIKQEASRQEREFATVG